ncbi:LOW QUALITY PROTEIN: hypothetical protein JCM18902_2480 [Psychrobacter sp. JCM 18902]|uniref:DUF1543 domain-containing protein n=1 Tax=Psychrobacter sp. JCM 18902 TaxID=1298607 RepID=UPI000434BD0E|nr:DUF1543 domain-containing protein [Psychrobacter sp. JCM 18902]GAF59611.1 LOW QUALITY PROTEIN: hypothetical protein JCM18902_2480 [Psychrobacter sp. JCM 18902]
MPTLFMVQLGGRPKGRLIEQHDIFFGVANQVSELINDINNHWPEVNNKWHIDSYRAITKVGNHTVKLIESDNQAANDNGLKLFFINLGGYQRGSFEEFHHKLLIVAATQAEAIKQAKQSTFYKEFTFKDKDSPFNAASHIDDKFEVDIDDIYNVNDLISNVQILIEPTIHNSHELANADKDKDYVGYLSIKNLRKLL